MKVLSLTEPFATLILTGYKRIETRSWKTNYRGELYIHASMTKISTKDLKNTELMSFVEKQKLNFGHIICKCNLVDCVYMTQEYVAQMKQNHYQEYLCGEYREGRYAWILENITPLPVPIKAKGQLNIWDFYHEWEIMKLMENIEYGWVDENHNQQSIIDEDFCNYYRLQSPKEVRINQLGICWDQVELERYYFKGNDWNIKTYFLVHYDQDKCPTHTFLTFEKNNKYYWFEHSFEKFRGIHEYKTQKELLVDVQNKFIQFVLNYQYEKENLILREYKKPAYHISVPAFYQHCEQGRLIDVNTLSP